MSKTSINSVIVSHLSDAQQEIKKGYLDKACQRINFAKKLIVDYPDTEREIEQGVLSKIWNQIIAPNLLYSETEVNELVKVVDINMNISDLKLSTRAKNALLLNDLKTLADLIFLVNSKTLNDICKIKYIGWGILKEIESLLVSMNIVRKQYYLRLDKLDVNPLIKVHERHPSTSNG